MHQHLETIAVQTRFDDIGEACVLEHTAGECDGVEGGSDRERGWPRRGLDSGNVVWARAVHELSICTSIAKIAHQAAAGRPVERVRIDVGHLRQVVPDTLRHSWEMVVFGTPFDGVALEVREVPAVIECRCCRTRTRLDDPIFRCGACGSTETDVVSGNELFVTSLDLSVEVS